MDEWFKSSHKISFLWCLSSFERTKKKNVCMNNPFLGTEAYAFIFLKNWTFKKGGWKGVRPLWEQLWHLKVKLTQKIGIKSVVDTPDVYCNCMQCSRIAHPFPPPFFEHSGACGMPLASLNLRFYGIFAILGATPELQRPIERLPPPFPPPFLHLRKLHNLN